MEMSKEHAVTLKRGQYVALGATIAILLLAGAKFVTGHLFESRILIADAFHSLIDVFAVFASWFGLHLAAHKKTNRFPYGLYKAETFVALTIGVLITWAGVETLLEGYARLFRQGASGAFPSLPVAVSIVSIAVAYLVARKESEVGRQIHSQALLANATESFLDIGTSAVVLAGIVLTYMKVPYVEGSIVMLIALLIIRLGVKNAWMAVLVLMDASLDPGLQAAIREKIEGLDGVKGVGEVKIRQSGPFKMVECEIATSPSLPVYKAHTLADEVERVIGESYSQIESVFVHVEPSRQGAVSAIIPVKEMNGLDSRVHGHFGRAPYFIILKITEQGVEIEDFYYNQFLRGKELVHVGVKVIKAILTHHPDAVFTAQIGEISFYMLKENFVEIYRADEGLTVREVMEQYRSGEVRPILTPHPAEESEMERRAMDGT
jgi:cation diffusion facilitator family transporter